MDVSCPNCGCSDWWTLTGTPAALASPGESAAGLCCRHCGRRLTAQARRKLQAAGPDVTTPLPEPLVVPMPQLICRCGSRELKQYGTNEQNGMIIRYFICEACGQKIHAEEEK